MCDVWSLSGTSSHLVFQCGSIGAVAAVLRELVSTEHWAGGGGAVEALASASGELAPGGWRGVNKSFKKSSQQRSSSLVADEWDEVNMLSHHCDISLVGTTQQIFPSDIF